MIKQKHFLDIDRLKLNTEVSGGNDSGFEAGDKIQITEKVDGSNGCIAYDPETDSLVAFSRKQTLSESNSLNGFWNYSQTLDKKEFQEHASYRVFGEWLTHNHIRYRKESYDRWYVYDIYDTDGEKWLTQDIVKEFCQKAGLEYVHVLYEGEFISWDHCKTFCHSPFYGDIQEGIVVKNQTKINEPDSNVPFVLKIVNQEYAETTVRQKKEVSAEELAERERAVKIVSEIVTRRRVEKELRRMQDERILPSELLNSDMKTIAKNLPKRIYDDCVKEEPEYVRECGDNFGKLCGSRTMMFVKEILAGK